MKKVFFSIIVFVFALAPIIAQHKHETDAPDGNEEKRFIKKETKSDIKRRANEMVLNDQANLRYQKKRWRNARYGGNTDAISKAGIKHQKEKLRDDKKRLKHHYHQGS